VSVLLEVMMCELGAQRQERKPQKQQMKNHTTERIYRPIQITLVHTYKTYKNWIVPKRKTYVLLKNGSTRFAMVVAADSRQWQEGDV
jgi:hypothetical protein